MPNITNETSVYTTDTENVVLNNDENNATTEEKIKKPRKPREKVREIEEIIDLPLTKLTDKEKNKLIEFFKANITEASNKVQAYRETTESALRKAKDTEDRYDAMENFYRRQLSYINMQLEAFSTAITQVTKGGIQ